MAQREGNTDLIGDSPAEICAGRFLSTKGAETKKYRAQLHQFFVSFVSFVDLSISSAFPELSLGKSAPSKISTIAMMETAHPMRLSNGWSRSAK